MQNIEFSTAEGAKTVLPYRFFNHYTRPIKEYTAEGYVKYIIDSDVVDIQRVSQEDLDRIWEELDSYNNAELWERR